MADTIKTTSELKLDMNFSDNDTRMLSVPNPKSNLTATAIKTLQTQMVTDQPVRGDKAGATFVRFNSARIVEQTRRVLDLT